MEKMTKKDKFKKFVYDHRETIAKVTVYTTLVVGTIALIARASSNMEKALDSIESEDSWQDIENEWLDEQHAKDKVVYLLHDWSYLVLPKDTEREWINHDLQKHQN